MTAVVLDNVTKTFRNSVVAVDGLNLDVGSGEFLVLLGPSGCGKSTVLRMIAGLEEPSVGRIMLDGEPADDMSPRERGVAMVFQTFGLYPHMNVAQNIGFPLRVSGVESDKRDGRVAEVGTALGLADLLRRKPSQLSGGQQQRVAMGRAIARQPRLFLMDEPLSNLDSGLRANLRAEITSMVRELGVTCVYVTHDQTEALTMADRVAILREGVLQDVGTPGQVYGQPATAYVAAFLGSPRMNLLNADVIASLDQHVELRLGPQSLFLPWNDMLARRVAYFHGERIMVGMRAEALIPVAATATGALLRGRVRHIEHHGHESVAFLDIGATPALIDGIDGLDGPISARAHNTGGAWRNLGKLRPGRRNGSPEVAQAGDRRYMPPSDVSVRLVPYPRLSRGEVLTLSVQLDALHFFDGRGARIDIGWR